MPFRFKPDPCLDSLAILPGMKPQRKGWILRKKVEATRDIRRAEAEASRTVERQCRRHDISLAQGLRKYRGRRGLTQKKMAAELGCSVRTYRGYESGERDMPGSILVQIWSRGDCDLHELLNVRSDPVSVSAEDEVFSRFSEAVMEISHTDEPMFEIDHAIEPARRIAFEMKEFGHQDTSSVLARAEEARLHLSDKYASGWVGDDYDREYLERKEEERRHAEKNCAKK